MYDNYLSRILIGILFPPILGCFFFFLLFYALGSKHGLLESAQVFVVFSIWSLFIFGSFDNIDVISQRKTQYLFKKYIFTIRFLP